MSKQPYHAGDPLTDFVSRRILNLCLRNGISKYRLYKITGISQANITKYIIGKSLPSLPNAKRICHAFGITLSQFFSQEEHPCADLTEEALEVAGLWSSLNLKDRADSLRHMQALRCLEEAEISSRTNAENL